jgi:hypothetical protein
VPSLALPAEVLFVFILMSAETAEAEKSDRTTATNVVTLVFMKDPLF